jgi:hypothetical protein
MSADAFVRTLQINPEVFRYPAARASRKKSQVQIQGLPPIRIKQAKPQVTLKRSKLLQQMRRIQQDRMQHGDQATQNEQATEKEQAGHAFQEALHYLEQHSNEDATTKQEKQQKQEQEKQQQKKPVSTTEPQYGCLKNGSKPCFRAWMQRIEGGRNKKQDESQNENQNKESKQNLNTWLEAKLRLRKTRDKELAKQGQGQGQGQGLIPEKYRLRRQKRTLRRTFRLGKKRHGNEVAVLVANKTLRQKTQTKINALRQVSLDDVRKLLIQKGLIKIGSAAPSDVLRKMYESVSLMCGDVTNHNGDNLVYNYFNAKPE